MVQKREVQKRLGELGLCSLEKRRLGVEGGGVRGGVLFNVNKYLKEECKEDGARLLSLVSSAGTQGNGHKLRHKRTSGSIFLQYG